MSIVFHHGLRSEDMIRQCIVDFRSKYDIFEKEFPDERMRKKYLRLRKHYNLKNQDFAESFRRGELLWRM